MFLRGSPTQLFVWCASRHAKVILTRSVTNHFVKQVHLHIQLDPVFNGSAHMALEGLLRTVQQFSEVKELHAYLELDSLEGNVVEDADVHTRISGFAVSMGKMFPRLQKVCVHDTHTRKVLDNTTLGYVNVLARQLYSLAAVSRHYTQRGNSLCVTTSPAVFSGLTSISCEWGMHYQHARRLIQHNSGFLKRLVVVHRHSRDICAFTKDVAGEDVRYPELTHLKMVFEDGFGKHNRVAIDAGTPFPAIQCLDIGPHYPFTDDGVFRGSEKTLKHLCLPLDQSTMKMFERAGTFANRRFSRIQYLRIIRSGGSLCEWTVPADQVFRFIAGIAPRPSTWDMVGMEAKNSILSTIQRREGLRNMRTLYLHDCLLTLGDVVALLKSLPYLEYLFSLGSDLREFSSRDAVDMLADYSAETWLGRFFVRWELGTVDMERMQNIIMCAIFLAITCPSFIHIETPLFADTEGHKIIKEKLRFPSYHAYNDRLTALLRV
ncbi:hypothetical protein GGF46_001174 [Coemansia sp. RSA 552]|nr:hypothetical protein GGF46_001174 [Coemansia sp. RSA 552]